MFAALSQLESEQLKQRQREGIEIAKAQGKYTGRKPLRSTGQGSVSSMGNGSPKVSQGVTLCGEWACTERIMVVPIDYGQAAHINIVS